MPELASPRARLAWANGNLESAARIIVADHLREMARRRGWTTHDFLSMADDLDPEGK